MQTTQRSTFQRFRSNLMSALSPVADKQYEKLRQQQNLSKKQEEFIEIYENVYLGYMASIAFLFPSIFYTRKAVQYRSKMVAYEPGFTFQGFNLIKNRLLTCSALGLSFIVATQIYSWRKGFGERSQEITQKYKTQ